MTRSTTTPAANPTRISSHRGPPRRAGGGGGDASCGICSFILTPQTDFRRYRSDARTVAWDSPAMQDQHVPEVLGGTMKFDRGMPERPDLQGRSKGPGA